MPAESTTLPAGLVAGAHALTLLRRWIFVLVKVRDEYVVPYTERRLRQIRESEDYPPTFVPFLERFCETLTGPSWQAGSYFPGGWFRQLSARREDVLQAPVSAEALGPFYAEEVRVDAEGRWWVGAKLIEGNVLQFFLRSLSFDRELSRYVIRYAMETHVETRYVHHQAPPYRVQALVEDPAGPLLALNDGTREPLRPETLRLDGRERLFCAVKQESVPAQFEDGPRWKLLDRIESTDAGWALPWAGSTHELHLLEPWRGADMLPANGSKGRP